MSSLKDVFLFDVMPNGRQQILNLTIMLIYINIYVNILIIVLQV